MTRKGPNFSDDPRLETKTADDASWKPLTPEQIEINRKGAELARAALRDEIDFDDTDISEPEVVPTEPESMAVQRLLRRIEVSEVTDSRTKYLMMREINNAFGWNEISDAERSRLMIVLDAASAAPVRDRDFRERQHND